MSQSGQQLADKLFLERHHGSEPVEPGFAWDSLGKKKRKRVERMGDRYLTSLSNKTPRQRAAFLVSELERNGFQSFKDLTGGRTIEDSLNTSGGARLSRGDKFYTVFHDTMVIAVQIGQEKMRKGINISTAHIDSPRLKSRVNPITQDKGLAYMRFEPVGGIEPEDYFNNHLDLHFHGSIDTGRRRRQMVEFTLEDMLITKQSIHLGENDVPEKGQLNVTLGNMPHRDTNFPHDQRVKLEALRILNEKYGVTESDFQIAEVTAVPSHDAVYPGLDKSIISGYGQDNWSCAYALLEGITKTDSPKVHNVAIWYDGEEIDDTGRAATSHKYFQEIMLPSLADMRGEELGDHYHGLKENGWTMYLDVGDVIHGFNPEAHNVRDSAYLGRGIFLQPSSGDEENYSGYHASPETLGAVFSLFDEKGIPYQIGENGDTEDRFGGKSDDFHSSCFTEGFDAGIPVGSMHRMNEFASPVDLFTLRESIRGFYGSRRKDYLPRPIA